MAGPVEFKVKVKSRGKATEMRPRTMQAELTRISWRWNLKTFMKIGDDAIREFMENVNASLARDNSTPYAPGAQADGLQRRSGKALKAMTSHTIRSTDKQVTGKIAVPFYLRQLERGGIVRARKGKYLAIPLPAALNADGTPIDNDRGRAWGRTFVIKSQRGNLVVVRRDGRHGLVPLYALKQNVRMPARPGAAYHMAREFIETGKRIQAMIDEADFDR